MLEQTDHFQVRYAIGACCTTGRNFLFAGHSPFIRPLCHECDDDIQVAILRVYAIGVWANEVQNANRNGVGAFTDIMYAVGDAGEMLATRTACNIVCGGYIVLTLGNGVFNGSPNLERTR